MIDVDAIYAIEEIEGIKNALLRTQRTIAVAESVTAGLLQNAFSQATDARKFFQGGITVYNIAQKFKHLGVEPIAAEAENGVSQSIANQLATNVGDLFGSHIGVGIVGYSAPVPEMGIALPFAYYAICSGGRLIESKLVNGIEGTPLQNQLHFVHAILYALRRILFPVL